MCPHRIVGITELIAGVWTRRLLDPRAADTRCSSRSDSVRGGGGGTAVSQSAKGQSESGPRGRWTRHLARPLFGAGPVMHRAVLVWVTPPRSSSGGAGRHHGGSGVTHHSAQQTHSSASASVGAVRAAWLPGNIDANAAAAMQMRMSPVSYTHLTLPTKA